MSNVPISTRNLLNEALNDKNSPLFLSKNVGRIFSFFQKQGKNINKKHIASFLAEKKSAKIVISNASNRKIAEVSRPFIGPQSFFQLCYCDLIVLSKNRYYGGQKKLILVLVESLSNFTLLEASVSTKSKDIISAFTQMFNRCKYLPEKLKTLSCDFGIEFVSKDTQAHFKALGVNIKPIKKRLDRLSKGASVVESTNRLVRSKLETYIADFGVKPLQEMLLIVENSINSEGRVMFGNLSSNQMLHHDPKYVSLLKASNHVKKRKALKTHIEKNDTGLDLYSIVRVRKFTKKEVLGHKESYGTFSDSLYIIIEKNHRDFVYYYKLGNLFNLDPVSESTFSKNELLLVDLTYEKACYIECLNTGKVIRNLNDEFVEFRPSNSVKLFMGPKAMFDHY